MLDVESWKGDGDMLTRETAHYMLHARANSLAAQEFQHIADVQERCWARITDELRIAPEFPIHYVLVDTPEAAGEIYRRAFDVDAGALNGFAAYPDTVVAVYNDAVKCIGMHHLPYRGGVHCISRGADGHARVSAGGISGGLHAAAGGCVPWLDQSRAGRVTSFFFCGDDSAKPGSVL